VLLHEGLFQDKRVYADMLTTPRERYGNHKRRRVYGGRLGQGVREREDEGYCARGRGRAPEARRFATPGRLALLQY
jgi:hypothetical protein